MYCHCLLTWESLSETRIQGWVGDDRSLPIGILSRPRDTREVTRTWRGLHILSCCKFTANQFSNQTGKICPLQLRGLAQLSRAKGIRFRNCLHRLRFSGGIFESGEEFTELERFVSRQKQVVGYVINP
jgi:hypothetical protein